MEKTKKKEKEEKETCNMTNTNLVTFKLYDKQFISKPLHFGNLNIKP